jgi:hypothetical protein
MRNTKELEVGIELSQTVEYGSSAESPLVVSHQRSTRNRGAPQVIFDGLGFIEYHPEEHHAMEDAPRALVHIFPPLNLLLSSLTVDWRFVLGVRLHHFAVRCENNVVLLEDFFSDAGVDARASRVLHDFKAAVCVLLNLLLPLCKKSGACDEKGCLGVLTWRRPSVDNVGEHLILVSMTARYTSGWVTGH